MKSTRFWIVMIGVLLIIAASFVVFQYAHKPAGVYADIYRDGVLIRTVNLREDLEFTIPGTGDRFNTIQIKDGAISVIAASCPDKICIHQGAISDGTHPIVCLPNKLVIKIEPSSEVKTDAIVG